MSAGGGTHTDPSAADVRWANLKCPKCGAAVEWVLAQLGGGYSYQPCGCHGGTVKR